MVFFSSTVILTTASALFLKERAGIHRWSAVVIGFGGVVIAMNPQGGGDFNAYLLVLVGTTIYTMIFIWGKHLSTTDSVISLVFLLQLGMGFMATLMLHSAGASYGNVGTVASPLSVALDQRKIVQFWIAYMTSVFAGLMAIGHAAGIALARNASIELATLAAITIGIGSAVGGFLAGWLVDRWPMSRFLVGLPLLSSYCTDFDQHLGRCTDQRGVAVPGRFFVWFNYRNLPGCDF